MHTIAQPVPYPFSDQITSLLKELHLLEGMDNGFEPLESKNENRRQMIRRELVQIVSRLGWRQGLPLRIWLRGRSNGRIQ